MYHGFFPNIPSGPKNSIDITNKFYRAIIHLFIVIILSKTSIFWYIGQWHVYTEEPEGKSRLAFLSLTYLSLNDFHSSLHSSNEYQKLIKMVYIPLNTNLLLYFIISKNVRHELFVQFCFYEADLFYPTNVYIFALTQ